MLEKVKTAKSCLLHAANLTHSGQALMPTLELSQVFLHASLNLAAQRYKVLAINFQGAI